MMATEVFLLTLLRNEVAASVAILLVLGLRRSAQRWVGPVLGYRLWGLVPAALVSAVMPGLAEWMNGGVVHLGADASPAGPSMLRAFTLLDAWRQAAPALFGVWSAGAASLALLFAAAEVHFRRKAARGLAGPALVGIAAPRLVVPADFRRRYDERERALIRRHERTHMEQNHPLANLALAVFQVVGWFNPLCHVAAAACRLDQELACDALVLEGRRRDRRLYARALLKAHRAWPHGPGAPFANAWTAAWPHPLEARLKALARRPLSVGEHVRGAVYVAAAGAVLAAVIWSVAPAPALTTPAADGAQAHGAAPIAPRKPFRSG